MTGYARIEENYENMSAAFEIKGYNNRYLEIVLTLPNQFSKFDAEMRRIVAGSCGRGKVEINMRVKDANNNLSVLVNENVLFAYINSYINAGEKISGKVRETGLQLDNKLSIDHLLSLEGVLEIEHKAPAEDENWKVLKPLFLKALERFNAEREREGAYTEVDILSYIEVLETSVKQIALYVPRIESAIQAHIKARFDELKVDGFDENRMLAETAILLMKYTIAEELARLDSHLAEFRSEVKRNGSPGKKLDFLSQEISREINTIGSKNTLLEVSKLVVVMKESLENIREQLRNVE
ncbi:MAG: YicC family protein [Spirochaetaceae bacterium]|jgi:uncharacterized protein (TIGR00255 family)|nr:YicC family protein [Spirochaetaceae bacterium]